MRKAYRITGSSFNHPGTLPEGFTVKERLVGEELELPGGLSFFEVKDGTIVCFMKGVSNSNQKLSREDIYRAMIYFNKILNNHTEEVCKHGDKLFSKCPGTPHRGHSASDWSCPLDRT